MNRFFDSFNSELDKVIMSDGNESVPVFASSSAENEMKADEFNESSQAGGPVSESSEIGYENAPPPAQRLRDFTPQEEIAAEEMEQQGVSDMNIEEEYGTGQPAAQPQMSSEPIRMFAPPGGQSNLPSGTGFLSAQVYTAERAIPIQGATVTILSTEGNEVIDVQETDRNGRTEAVALPAPPKGLSQTPNGSATPFYIYVIRVEHPQYYPVENRGAQVFDGVYSIQPVALLPLEERSEGSHSMVIEPTDTRSL